MREADLVIAVGYDLVEYSPKNWNRHLDKKIIHIDFTLAEVDTYYPPTVEIAADIEATIYALLNELAQVKKENPNLGFAHSEVPPIFRQIKEDVVFRVLRYNNDFSYPIKPEKLVTDVRSVLDASEIHFNKPWNYKMLTTIPPVVYVPSAAPIVLINDHIV